MGATSPIPCRVRLVAATNRDLAQAVEEQRFRGDLLARLDEVRLRPPPLRERREDLLLLLDQSLRQSLGPVQLTPRLVDRLLRHGWPFNVRELMKVASQLALYGAGRETLDADLVAERLPGAAREGGAKENREALDLAADPVVAEKGPKPPPPTAGELRELYRECNGNISELARRTGRSRRQVRRWLEEAGEEVE